MNIVWSPEAIEDLVSLRAYITEDDPAAARRVVLHIVQNIEQLLPDNPQISRAGRVPGTRELVIPRTPYIVPDRVQRTTIQILRVYHAARVDLTIFDRPAAASRKKTLGHSRSNFDRRSVGIRDHLLSTRFQNKLGRRVHGCRRFNSYLFAVHVQNARPWIEYGNSGGNKLAGIARDDGEVFQRGNGRNEQVWLPKGVAALLSFDRHRLPANDDVFGNREHAPKKKQSQGPVEPHVNVRATACVFKLFDPEPDFTKCDFGGKKHLTRLRGDELSNSRIWSRLAKLGNDVRIEKPTPHRLTSRTGDLTVSRSIVTSASGEHAAAGLQKLGERTCEVRQALFISQIFLLRALETALRGHRRSDARGATDFHRCGEILKEAHWLSLHSAIPRRRAAASKRSS
jgi:toxin ParE1/3/4